MKKIRIFKALCKLVPKDETIIFSSEDIKNHPVFSIIDGVTFEIKKVEESSIEAEIEIKVGKEDKSVDQDQKKLVEHVLNAEDQKIFKKEFLKLQTWFSFFNLKLGYESGNLKMFVFKGTTITGHKSINVGFAVGKKVKVKSLKVEKFFKETTLSQITEFVLEINKLVEIIKKFKETSSKILEGEEKLIIPMIFFWICRIYFQQRNLKEFQGREYSTIFDSGMSYSKERALDFEQIVKNHILNSGDKIKGRSKYSENEDKQHIDIAFDLGFKEDSNLFLDLVVLRPVRNLAVHFYENSIEKTKKEKDNLIKFITYETDNYISITEKMVSKCSEMVVSEYQKFFENTGKTIEIIR